MLDAKLAQALHAREQFGVDLVFVRHAGRVSVSRTGNEGSSQTGRTDPGSLAKRPGGFHGTAGSWKSEPTEPSSRQRTASEMAASRSRGLPDRKSTRLNSSHGYSS